MRDLCRHGRAGGGHRFADLLPAQARVRSTPTSPRSRGNSPIDVTLYNIPMFASPIDVPTIRRLAEFPRIVGIKDSSGDLAFMMRMIAAVRPSRPDFTFLTGWEAVLVPMLMIGCDGGTNASSNVVPELTRKLYDLRRPAIRRGHEAAVPHPGTVRRHAATVRVPRRLPRRGRDARLRLRPRPPALSTAQEADRTALQSVLQCILADFGLVDPAAAGCAPRTRAHGTGQDRPDRP